MNRRDDREPPMYTAQGPQPGEVAYLRVVEVNDTGAFLDWDRPKDLLLPYREQPTRVVAGQHCLVCILLDASDRPFASLRLDDWLHDAVPAARRYENGAPVTIVIAGETDLGLKVVVDDRFWGLVHRDDIFRTYRRGQRFEGRVKKQRDDGRLDITLNPPAHEAASALGDRILAAIDAASGKLMLSDKSPPEAIQARFGVSKGVFKQAIGALYRERRIVIEPGCIRRAAP